MNIFYKSGILWFDYVANGCIWALILTFTVFLLWLGFDLVTGPRRQRADVARMLSGLDTTLAVTGISSHRAGAPAKSKDGNKVAKPVKVAATDTFTDNTTPLDINGALSAPVVSGSPFAPHNRGKRSRKATK
jgi:hypothetical protein